MITERQGSITLVLLPFHRSNCGLTRSWTTPFLIRNTSLPLNDGCRRRDSCSCNYGASDDTQTVVDSPIEFKLNFGCRAALGALAWTFKMPACFERSCPDRTETQLLRIHASHNTRMGTEGKSILG